MLTVLAFLMVGILVGVGVGVRLKNPYVWLMGFGVGVVAGMALAIKNLWGVVYGRWRWRFPKRGRNREDSMLPWVRNVDQGQGRRKGTPKL